MARNINVIVFGGTGSIGPFILERMVKEGFNVTAFVRTPSKISEKLRKDLRVVKGDVLNRDEVVNALEGQDMVLSALGAGFRQSPTTLMTDGCRNIVFGMKKQKVQKMVMIMSALMLPGEWKPWLLRHLIADYKEAMDHMQTEKSDIDWILLMPPFIKPTSQISEKYFVEKNKRSGGMTVTAGDIADFMTRVVRDGQVMDEMRHCMVGISGRPAYISAASMKVLAGVVLIAFTACVSCYFDILPWK